MILLTGFDRADPIASLFVAASMLAAAVPLLRASGRILLEAAPEGLSPEEIGSAVRSHAGVTDVHDLHVWEISSGFPALSAHVLVRQGEDCHGIRREDSRESCMSASESTTRRCRSSTPRTSCSRFAPCGASTRTDNVGGRAAPTLARADDLLI